MFIFKANLFMTEAKAKYVGFLSSYYAHASARTHTHIPNSHIKPLSQCVLCVVTTVRVQLKLKYTRMQQTQ